MLSPPTRSQLLCHETACCPHCGSRIDPTRSRAVVRKTALGEIRGLGEGE